jgi:hypothetical protein
VDAQNRKHSPEKGRDWERADPFNVGAGNIDGALMTSAVYRHGVADRIELHNGQQATRRVTNKGSWGSAQGEYPSMSTKIKRGAQMAASRVMESLAYSNIKLA